MTEAYIGQLGPRFPPVIGRVIAGYLGPCFRGLVVLERSLDAEEAPGLPAVGIPYGTTVVDPDSAAVGWRPSGAIIALADGRVACLGASGVAVWDPLLDQLDRYPTSSPATALLALPDGRFVSLHQPSAICVWGADPVGMGRSTFHVVGEAVVGGARTAAADAFIGAELDAWSITHMLWVSGCTIATYGWRGVTILDLDAREVKTQWVVSAAALPAKLEYWCVLPSEYFDDTRGERVVYLTTPAGGVVVKCYGDYAMQGGFHCSDELTPLAPSAPSRLAGHAGYAALLSVTAHGPFLWWPKLRISVPVSSIPAYSRLDPLVHWVLSDGQLAARHAALAEVRRVRTGLYETDRSSSPSLACVPGMRAQPGTAASHGTAVLGEELAALDDDGAITVWGLGLARLHVQWPATRHGFAFIVSIGGERIVAQTSDRRLVLLE
jgi:hypothetical protein